MPITSDAAAVIMITKNALSALDFHKEHPDSERIKELGLIRDYMLILQTSDKLNIISEITQGVGKRKVKRIFAHWEVATCLESEDFRWNLSVMAATETIKNEALNFSWSDKWKNNVRESGYCKLLCVCLDWLLQSIQQYCAIELPDGYKKKLKEYPIEIHQYAFNIISNKAKEWSDVEGVIDEVNIYLQLLIEQIAE